MLVTRLEDRSPINGVTPHGMVFVKVAPSKAIASFHIFDKRGRGLGSTNMGMLIAPFSEKL